MSDYTAFLYAKPSFIEGVARLLDFGNTLNIYNSSPSEEDADGYALATDWHAVGEDLYSALRSQLSGGSD